ncbi:5'-nucleotidase C-terminal domain-containing protein [Aeromicrobium massiliense]|uniref:5'-nucleotidase C-terminal domain-containing protein n=1 Tax=Aeromicrobium massiliense TaxID=1464554 RepID=UPI0002EC4801|nr:5'-nucleotidase C-terminal domain-containing protein [Aeromicrobium massiliense]
MNLLRRRTAIGVAALLSCGGLAVASPAHAADPVTVNLIDVNDFHGRIDANTVKVAGTVEQLRAAAGDANTLFLSAGDNIGASLFASSSQKDEPTIDVLDALDLAVSAVGNHELDGGEADLAGRVEGAADYQHVAANIYRKGTTDPVLPAYETFTVAGQDVAVIGATTEETASLVSPAGVANLEFGDPVEAVNRVARQLEASADKPDVIVASYHEGAGFKTPGSTTLEQEVADGGAFADIVTKTDPAVDAIFTGHTHKEYAWNAPVPGVAGKTRPVVQTGSYGERIGQVQLKVDPDTGEVVSYTAGNVARTTAADDTLAATYPRVAEVKTIVDDALAKAKALGEQPVATISADITTAYTGSTRDDRANESTLGNLVADAVLAQVSQLEVGADLGIANPGGLRAELIHAGSTGADAAVNKDGVVTFAEANAVLPFNNTLSSVSLKGSSLKKVFEQQWQTNPDGSVPTRAYLQLGTSANVQYTYDDTRERGDRITSLTIDGDPLDPDKTYRVATFSFLGAGGDNFRAFTEGSNFDTGLQDYQAWMDYLKAESPVAPDYRRHAVKVAGDRDVVLGEALDLTFPKLDLTSRGVPATTSVSASLVLDGTTTDLGTFPAAAGSARVTVPATTVAGTGTVRVTAQPTGATFEVPVSVGKVESTTTAQGPDTVERGEQAVVDVEVTTEGDLVPSGRVDVLSGSTVVGTATLDQGVVSVDVDTTGLAVGTRTLTVAYAGDDSVQASTSTVDLKVERGASAVTVGQVAKAPVTGVLSVPVTVTSATGVTPTGQVEVLGNERVVGTADLASGRATVRVPAGALGVGVHELDVQYVGDLQHEAATASASATVTVAPTALKATGYAGTYGKVGTVVVTGPAAATGTVTVTRGSTRLGVSYLDKGRAVVQVAGTALKPGAHTLTVTYPGNGTYAGARTTVRVTVAKARTSVTAKVTTRKVVVKKTRAKVAVTVRAYGVPVTSGTVGVYQGSKRVGTATVRDGKATVRLARLTKVGTQRLTVKYAGASLFSGSTTTVKVKVARR